MGTLSKYSARLDGSNEHILIGNVAALDFDRTNTFSASAWIQLNTSGAQTIVSKQAASTTYQGWSFEIGSGGYLQFALYNDFTGGNRLAIRTTSAIPAGSSETPYGTWHHVVVTYSGSSDVSGVKFYIDGVEVTTKTTIFNTLSATTLNAASAYIGRRGDAVANYLNGNIDEVAVYNKELTAGEVTTLLNSGDPPDLTLTGPTGNLVGYWKIGDGDTYPTAIDSSVSGNNGTYTNTETTDIEPYAPAQNSITLGGFTFGAISSPSEALFGPAPGTTIQYFMEAFDSVTGSQYTWVSGLPDWTGTGYPGPNSPTDIAVSATIG